MLREEGNFSITIDYLRYVHFETSDKRAMLPSCERDALLHDAHGRMCILPSAHTALVLSTLSPLSAELCAYEDRVDLWLAKRALLLIEIARIKSVSPCALIDQRVFSCAYSESATLRRSFLCLS
jgi:hypothetical protein